MVNAIKKVVNSSGELKREALKYVRDFIKRSYKAKDNCYICDKDSTLELHHIFCLAPMFNKWLAKNKILEISTVSDMNAIRARFEQENKDDLSNDNLFTLCAKCHERLHSVYGLNYEDSMAPKVKRWLNIQREKRLNGS